MKWTIYPIGEYEGHKQEWDKLNSRNGNTPLLDSRFVSPLLHNFGTNREKLAICKVNGTACCMAIVVRTRLGVWQTFQPSQAPIGCWVQAGDTPIELLANTLRKALPGPVFLLGITQQDPGLLPRPDNSPELDTIDYISTARVAIDCSFDDYWSKRGKNLRQNLRRQRNRLGREHVDIELLLVQAPELIHDAVNEYGILETAGWKSESNTAIHIDNSQGRFYEQMLSNFAENSQAIIFQYRYNKKLVATDLCIIGGGSLIILKTTYDESISTSSPAMLMREEAFNVIFSEHLADKIEFYGKVMDWHTKWAEDIRKMYHINCHSHLGAKIKALTKRQ